MILSCATRFSRLCAPSAAASAIIHSRSSNPPPRTTLFYPQPSRCFRVGAAEPAHPPGETDMENQVPKPADEVTTDGMAESFGEGYSTRSDEEGFGGIYGSNQTLPSRAEDDAEAAVRPTTHPHFDKSQGSEVKEKEKARHQTSAEC